MPYVKSYWGAVQKGQVFTASVTGGTTTVGTATTYTGLALTNPVGSGVKLAITHVGLGFLVAWPAAATVGIMTGKNASAVTQTTPVTPTGNRVNATALTNTGLAASAVTFPASPTLAIVLGAGLTGAITSFTQPGRVYPAGRDPRPRPRQLRRHLHLHRIGNGRARGLAHVGGSQRILTRSLD